MAYKCFGWAAVRLSLGVDRVDRGFMQAIVSFCTGDYIWFSWLFILGDSRWPYTLLYIRLLSPSSPILLYSWTFSILGFIVPDL